MLLYAAESWTYLRFFEKAQNIPNIFTAKILGMLIYKKQKIKKWKNSAANSLL